MQLNMMAKHKTYICHVYNYRLQHNKKHALMKRPTEVHYSLWYL